MAWRFEASTLGHVRQGEIEQATGRNVSEVMRKSRSATFAVDFAHPMADLFMSCDCLVQVFDENNTCRFNGPVLTPQEDSSEEQNKIVVTAFDPSVDLLDRLCGKDPKGFTMGTAVNPVDSIAIVKSLIDVTNIFETGIDTSGMTGTASKVFVGPYYYKPILNVMNELANVLDGFDWTVVPQRVIADKIGVLVAAGAFGGPKPDAVFEYGDGLLNVESYSRAVDRTSLLNAAYSLPPGFPDNATQNVIAPDINNGTADSSSIIKRGLHEGVVAGDFSADSLRTKLMQENVRLRKQPKQQITFKPKSYLSGTTPVFGRDFGLGDVVPFRATVNGKKRIDIESRVYGCSHDLDDVTGVATPSVTIVSD
jgi:hypothetical protein